MSTLMGVDSESMVPLDGHHAIGSTVQIGYLSRSTGKVLSPAAFDELKAGGVSLCLVFEDSATNATLGYDQGKSDAEWGLKQAIDLYGHPPHSPPRFPLAVDYDPSPSGAAARTDAYFDGAAAVLGKPNTGPYGGYDMVAHAHERGFGTLFGTYAWSGGRQLAEVCWQQYSNDHTVAGVGVDYDHCYPDKLGDFKQWDYTPATPPDPYAIFHPEPIAWTKRDGAPVTLHERHAVRRYDALRNHPARSLTHRRELLALRAELALCAQHIYFQAHWGEAGLPGQRKHHLPPRWRYAHLGARYQGVIRRAHGKEVAPLAAAA